MDKLIQRVSWTSMKRGLRLLMHNRIVRYIRYWVRNATLPGNKNVPLYDVLRYIMQGIFNGALWRASKGLAFSFLMSIPPLLIFLFTLIAYLPVDGLQDELLLQLKGILPERVFTPIANTIDDVMGHKHKNLLSIGFFASIILAANAMHGMMMYFSDRGKQRRKFFVRYPICIGMVFLIDIVLVLVLCTFIGYRLIIEWCFSMGYVEPGSLGHALIGVGRWVLLIFMTLLTLSAIYYVVPIRKQRVGFFSSGAIFSTIMFILLSWAFRSYLAHFTQYNLLYGSIGTILVLMLWVFFNCLVLMVGYEVNTAILDGKLNCKTRHRLKSLKPEHTNLSIK